MTMTIDNIIDTTMNRKIIYLLIVTIVLSASSFSVIDVLGYSFVGVTSNGVEFPILSPVITTSIPSGNDTAAATGDSIFDGLGVYLTIQNIGTNGQVYFGEGDNPGEQTDIRQYVGIGVNDDWVVAVTDDDYSETLFVPEFRKEYTYVAGTLIESGSLPNILGYSESRDLSGSIDIVINNDGMFFSGDGEAVIKLNDYTDQTIFLKGVSNYDGTSDNIIQIITSDIDLMNDPYDSTNGYLMYSNTIDPGENAFSITAGIDSTHTGLQTFTASGSMSLSKGHCTGGVSVSTNYGTAYRYSVCSYRVISVSPQGVTEVKIDNGDHYIITGDSTTHALLSSGNPSFSSNPNSNFNFELYDTLPSIQLTKFTEGYFEKVIDFPAEQTYLYVKLEGEIVKSKVNRIILKLMYFSK